jgi:ribose transport system substrate-binding protein
MMEKRLLHTIASGVVALVLLAGCSQADPVTEPESPTTGGKDPAAVDYKMAFSGSELSNPWVGAVRAGFEAACQDNGLTCTSLDAGSDVDKQVQDIQNAVNGGNNAIVMNPIDGTALQTILTQATADGIASITIAQTADASTGALYLDDAAYGTIIADNAVSWIEQTLGGEGTVAILGEENIQSSIARGDAIEATIKSKLPNMTIVARQHANTPDLGLSVTQNILLANPDLNVVIAANDSGGIGAYQAFENAGLATDPNRAIFSGDKTDEALQYIKIPDSIYRGTVDLSPYDNGYQAVEMALRQLQNGLPAQTERVALGMVPYTKAEALAGQ